jgi:hypothetical protein
MARKMLLFDMRGIGARFVYIVRSDSDPSRHYVGRTANVDERLQWHNAGRAAIRFNIDREAAHATYAARDRTRRLCRDHVNSKNHDGRLSPPARAAVFLRQDERS